MGEYRLCKAGPTDRRRSDAIANSRSIVEGEANSERVSRGEEYLFNYYAGKNNVTHHRVLPRGELHDPLRSNYLDGQ